MKKKYLFALIFCAVLALTAVAFLAPRAEPVTVYAVQNHQDIQELLENTIAEVEEELAEMNTDVVSELYNLLAKYEATLPTVRGC